MQNRRKRAVFAVWITLRTAVLLIAVRCAFQMRWESFFTCLLALVLFLAPSFAARKLRLRLPSAMEITVLIFIFCAEILGEVAAFYVKYPFWDTMLHTVNGFLFAAFGFSLADLLNGERALRFRLSPPFLALAAFCFSMTAGVLWEFLEFAADRLLPLDMQKDTVISGFHSVLLDPAHGNRPVPVQEITETVISLADGRRITVPGYLDTGLADTMKDLFVNFLGAAVFSAIGARYVRRRGKQPLAAAFIPTAAAEAQEPPHA